MRVALALSLALLASSSTLAEQKPIPQNTARMEAQARARLEWHRQTLRSEYDRVGNKDPRWDKLAHETLDLAIGYYCDLVDPRIELEDVHVAAKKAIDAGCDDPLILYLHACSSLGPHYPKPAEFIRRLKDAGAAMSSSSYSPFRRATAMEHAVKVDASMKLTPEQRLEKERGLDAVIDLLPKSLAEDPRGEDWEDGWFRLLSSVILIHRDLSKDYKAAFDRVDAKLAGIPEVEALRLLITGDFQLKWGWESRGSGYANTVGEDQFRIFEKRLQQARASLEAAYKLNPNLPHVAQTMLTVERGIGGGDRAAIDLWFDRAMEADGNDSTACSLMMEWLEPKWYGDEDRNEMLAFGRACAATKNWRNGITTFVIGAHNRRYKSMEPKDWKPYITRPDVWADYSSVYPEYLKHYPNNYVDRSKYAMACFSSGHYQEADEQFKILGDNLTEWNGAPQWPLEDMKKYRGETARYINSLKKAKK